MCVYSLVIDHYEPLIPKIDRAPAGVWPWTLPVAPTPVADLSEFEKLIGQMKEALAAAKKVDDLTGQPDCEDPEKARLLERVAELEKLLGNVPQFVVASGISLEPGTYRILDGKLYKVIST